MTGHSPTGGSAAERVIPCPGSVGLISRLPFAGEDEESEFAARGSAAHHAAAICLEQGIDAWEVMDQEHIGIKLDAEDCNAFQIYLDTIRADGIGHVEQSFSCPDLHPWIYGTIDHWKFYPAIFLLQIDDYKHGVGVFKKAEGNEQLLYYAFMVLRKLLEDHPELVAVRPQIRVRMRIIQPRCPYGDPIRTWEVDADYVLIWGHNTLLPKIREAEAGSDEFNAGSWCQFCPAKLYCPKMEEIHNDALDSTAVEINEIADETLATLFDDVPILRMRIKAITDEVTRRMNAGSEISTAKWVAGKADRVWRDNVQDTAVDRFGTEALTKPELKSPAQIEKLIGGKDFVKEYAYKPQGQPRVVHISDKATAIKPRTNKDAFAGYTPPVN